MQKHIRNIPKKRQAIAPYNFIELPEQVVSAELENNSKLRDNNCYYLDRHSGRIECVLTTSSPLYIRCGLTSQEFQEGKESKDNPDFYYIDPKTKKPILPGSSLRGMLRSLVEIISFSKISQVSEYQRLFFRAVAALPKDDSLAKTYREYIKQGKVKAGYLKKEATKWNIYPAKEIRVAQNFVSFAWVKEDDLSFTDFPEFKKFNDSDYILQNIPVSFKKISLIDNKYIAEDVTIPGTYPQNQGRLVTSGNMKEISKPDSDSIRKYHCIIFDNHPNPAKKYTIEEEAIDDYKNALTDFQKTLPLDEELGILKDGNSIFYCEPEEGNPVKIFGHSPYFRIPFLPYGNGRAATVVDFIPEDLRDESRIDIVDAIFGFVRSDKQAEDKEQSRAGRICVTDATCVSSLNNIYLTNQDVITPKVLANPKPTTYQHYLVQPEATEAKKSELKHYGHKPIEDTVIRGHKLYWHQGEKPNIKHPDKENVNESQLTQIKPIKPGVSFQFTIYFENLTNVELGALMWVFDKGKNEKYRLKLGMGKPLGMGAIQIEHKLYLSNRKKRYTQLFNEKRWQTAEQLDSDPPYLQDFENYILQQTKTMGKFENIPRVQMLLAMLCWPGLVDSKTKSRYMEIERDTHEYYLGQKSTDETVNEYKERFLLPTPLQIMGIEIEDELTASIKNDSPAKESENKFFPGQEVDAKVIAINLKPIKEGKKNKSKTIIFYQIEGSNCQSEEEVYKQEVKLNIDDIVKVQIVKVKNLSIRKVKQIDKN